MVQQTEQLMTTSYPAIAPAFSFQETIPLIVIIWGEIIGLFVAVIVNPLTIKAIITFKLMRKTVSNLFILNLCIADFVFGANCLIVKIIHLLQMHGLASDDFLRVLSWVCGSLVIYGFFVELISIITIGVDRALATVKPFSHRRLLTIKSGLVVVLFGWIYTWFITFPPIIINVIRFKSISEMPVLHQPAGAFPPPYIQGFTTPYIISMFILCAIVYGLVVISYFRAKRRTNIKSDSSKKKAQRMSKMVIAIVGVLILCNAPMVILAAFSFTIPMNQMWHLTLYEFGQFLSVLSVSINNFLYAWHIDYYKEAYMELLCCKPPNSDGGNSTSSTSRDRSNSKVVVPRDRSNSTVSRMSSSRDRVNSIHPKDSVNRERANSEVAKY